MAKIRMFAEFVETIHELSLRVVVLYMLLRLLESPSLDPATRGAFRWRE